VFGVLVVPARTGADLVAQEIVIILTTEHLLTVRKTPLGHEPCNFDPVRDAAVRGGASPAMCLYYLMDEIAERFLTLIDAFDDAIDELEDNITSWANERVREQISSTRHDILRARRVLTPTRDAARAVLDDRVELDGGDLFPRDVELHFADVYDKFLRATDGLDLSRDLLAGVRDYHQAQIANDQNEVMKRLTVVASVLLVPTFIVGLYGQNLRGAPELHWSHGYLFSWVLIIVTTVAQLAYYRRKRWI
jgi:magnesium transporter